MTYVEPVPPGDRYNLAFHARYGDHEVLLREVDAHYFRLYHDELPQLISSQSPWNSAGSGKNPSSRSTCRCDLIQQVRSINDIVRALYDFISSPMRPHKLIGTIFISAHGSANAVSLPISPGARVLSVAQLGEALFHVSAIDTTAPRGFPQAVWDEIRRPLQTLETNLTMLRRRIDGWFDAHSLIRFWVCNLGQDPAGGAADPLAAFGRILVPHAPLSVEAPRGRSLATFTYYTGSPPGRRVYLDEQRRHHLHPDVVAEVESNPSQLRYTGQELNEARDAFGSSSLRSGPPPEQTDAARQWVPIFAVQGGRGPVYQGQYQTFRTRWRTVSLPDRRSPP